MADEGGVLDDLRAAILAGHVIAGDRHARALCERFGCGRFAVRAAIPVLASEGLVDVQRHRGARVRIIPLAEAIEIAEGLRQAARGAHRRPGRGAGHPRRGRGAPASDQGDEGGGRLG